MGRLQILGMKILPRTNTLPFLTVTSDEENSLKNIDTCDAPSSASICGDALSGDATSSGWTFPTMSATSASASVTFSASETSL